MSIVEPNVLELLQHADTRYTLVVEASKRGRQIVADSSQGEMGAESKEKPLKRAIEEINNGMITYRRTDLDEETIDA